MIPDLHPPSSRRHGVMLAQPFDEHRLERWSPPWIVQPKLDGERCRAIINAAGIALLLSSEEHIITSVPHINRALERCGLRGIELDGELYAHGMCFEEIHSRIGRTVNLHASHDEIEYHIFDLVTEGIQGERTLSLKGMQHQLKHPLYTVPFVLCDTLDEIMQAYERYQRGGFEGVVVRHAGAPYERKRSLWMMKWKPKKEDFYVCVGAVEECDKEGRPKGRLGALVCRGEDGTEFNVGTGFDADSRSLLWAVRNTLPGRVVRVAYQHTTSGKGVPRFPVYIGFVDPTQG